MVFTPLLWPPFCRHSLVNLKVQPSQAKLLLRFAPRYEVNPKSGWRYTMGMPRSHDARCVMLKDRKKQKTNKKDETR